MGGKRRRSRYGTVFHRDLQDATVVNGWHECHEKLSYAITFPRESVPAEFAEGPAQNGSPSYNIYHGRWRAGV